MSHHIADEDSHRRLRNRDDIKKIAAHRTRRLIDAAKLHGAHRLRDSSWKRREGARKERHLQLARQLQVFLHQFILASQLPRALDHPPFENFVQRPQISLGSAPRHPLRHFAQRTAHRRHQPRQPVLQHEISCAVFQKLHSRLLADGSGNNDKRDIRAALFREFQRLPAVKGRKPEIREDELRKKSGDLPLKVNARLHTSNLRLHPSM